MEQLRMHWENDGTPARTPQLPENVTLVTFPKLPGALDAWLDIVQYGLSGKRQDEAYYRSCMLDRPHYREDHCFFLCVEGVPAATITVIVDDDSRAGYVHMVACKPEFRGHGLGHLLNEVARWVLKTEGMATASLTTDDWRIPAIKSYLKAGFMPDTSTEDFAARWGVILDKIEAERKGKEMYRLWNALTEAKKMKWVELSHLLDNDSPYWSGIPEGSVCLGDVVFDWGNPMLECQIQTFKFPGQFGTHIDFPAHFAKGAACAESFGMKDAVFPLCVVDITEKVQADPTYCVTVEDIQAYEAQFGPIPEGAFVALRTDWSKNWPDMNALSGIAEDGSENFPGWSLEAIRYIYEVRRAAANGHETLDTDGSAECARQGDLACERYVLSHGKVQIEVLCNLDKVPAAGAVLFASWPNFKGANGLPCRVFAVFA